MNDRHDFHYVPPAEYPGQSASSVDDRIDPWWAPTRVDVRRLIVSSSSILILASVTAHADFLDFTELGDTGHLPTAVANLSNATLTSLGENLFIGPPGVFGESNLLGIVCASPFGNDSCVESLQIEFLSSVTNLSFSSFGVDTGDSVEVFAYLGATLLGSTVVTTQTVIDFTGFGLIDRLLFDDNSILDAAGIGWGDFSFDATPVREPPGVFVLISGLMAFALARRSQSRATAALIGRPVRCS